MDIEEKYEFHFTKQEIMDELDLGEDFSWDYALPQDWLNEITDKYWIKKYGFTYDDIRTSIVWMYDPKHRGGRPFPVTDKGHAILKILKYKRR